MDTPAVLSRGPQPQASLSAATTHSNLQDMMKNLCDSQSRTGLSRVLDIILLQQAGATPADKALIRDMRSVSKEFESAATRHMKSASVNLGLVWSSPNIQLMIRLNNAVLQTLKVNYTLTSGHGAPPFKQQLSTCILHTKRLVANMGNAIRSVTTLELNIIHENRALTESRADERPHLEECQCVRLWKDSSDTSFQFKEQLRKFTEQQQQQQQLMGSKRQWETAFHLGLLNPGDVSSDEDNDDDDDGEDWDGNSMGGPAPFVVHCPLSYGFITKAVFAMLAASVPKLKELKLRGCCWDASFPAFGSLCPSLTSLEIEAVHTPASTLRDIGQHLPNLTSVHVGTRNLGSNDQQQLGMYMDAFLLEMGQCTSLSKLSIRFPWIRVLTCKNWNQLPASLVDFKLVGRVSDMNRKPYQNLMCRVPRLALEEYLDSDLVQLSEAFPVLLAIKMAIAGTTIVFDLGILGYRFSGAQLSECVLLKGLLVNCSSVVVEGTSAQVQDLFEALPSLGEEFHSLSIEFTGNIAAQCLSQVSHVFPGLMHLEISGKRGLSESAVISPGCFAPLALCSALNELSFGTHFPLTTQVLLDVCTSNTKLAHIAFVECDGVDHAALSAELLMSGRDIYVQQLSHSLDEESE